jgi:hypothetical protein
VRHGPQPCRPHQILCVVMALQDKVKQFPAHDWEWFDGQCGHCGNFSNLAIIGGAPLLQKFGPGIPPQEVEKQVICVCASCQGINVLFIEGGQFPGPLPGRRLAGLPPDVQEAWDEARAALGAMAPVASEHMCRKLLIHIAAEQAKKKCSNFTEAVSALVEAKVITEQMKPWVDRIRLNGNEAAHELQKRDVERAKLTLEFTQALLQIVYEMKHRLEQSTPVKQSG